MKGTSAEPRFWSKICKTESCWLWTGNLDDNGYGYVCDYGVHVRAHRYSWILHNGPILNDLHVLHNCSPNPDNPSCVCPQHLWLGTQLENDIDRDKKGSTAKGDQHGMVKLAEGDVIEIRKLYTGEIGQQRRLAKQFGVSTTVICQILTGKAWSHLPLCKIHIPKMSCDFGDNDGRKKLTRLQVDEIRQIRAESSMTQQQIADKYGVSRTAISLIVRGKNWNYSFSSPTSLRPQPSS